MLFPIKRRSERLYLKNLASDINSFCEESHIASKQELYDNYGTPCEIMNNYFSAMDTNYIIKRLKLAKFIKISIVVFLAIAAVLTASVGIYLHKTYQRLDETFPFYIEEVIVVHERQE